MRKDQLAFLVLCILYVNLNLVAYCELGVVTEFVDADDAFALVTDVDDYFAFVDGGNDTLDNFIFADA